MVSVQFDTALSPAGSSEAHRRTCWKLRCIIRKFSDLASALQQAFDSYERGRQTFSSLPHPRVNVAPYGALKSSYYLIYECAALFGFGLTLVLLCFLETMGWDNESTSWEEGSHSLGIYLLTGHLVWPFAWRQEIFECWSLPRHFLNFLNVLFDELGETHLKQTNTHKVFYPRCNGLEIYRTDTHKMLLREFCQFILKGFNHL